MTVYDYDLTLARLSFQLMRIPDSPLHVLRYRGTEGLSQLFRFEIELYSDDLPLDVSQCISQPARLGIETPSGHRFFHGLVSRFAVTGHGTSETYYHAEIVPTFWLLTHRYGSRIFQNKTVPDIVAEVLTRAGWSTEEFQFRLTARCSPRAYCVQYRETDFNFVSRLLEEEGIYYFFEHDHTGHRLIFADNSTVLGSRPDVELPFIPPTGMNCTGEHVSRFVFGQEVRPGSVVLRDYNFEKPNLDLQAQISLERDRNLEFSDFPGEYRSQKEGYRLARLRSEEFECRRQVAHGTSNCSHLVPGHGFALRGHPHSSANQVYLVTKIVHEGRQCTEQTSGLQNGSAYLSALRSGLNGDRADKTIGELAGALAQAIEEARANRRAEPAMLTRWLYHAGQIARDPAAAAVVLGRDPLEALAGGHLAEPLPGRDAPTYACRFECIPATVTFRPPRVTPWPVMRGCQTAVVVGTENEEIYTDRYGRIKVQFHWDREGKKNEHSSCWIRVSQPWAGAGYGGLAIPRVGQEVIVDFLEGDPDRPIVVGRVYNESQMPPQSLPANKVRTSIRSQTYKGVGSNEITMDDTPGKEHFYEHAQYDKTVEIGNNRNTSVGMDSTEIVGNNVVESVGNNKSTDVACAYNETCDTYVLNARTSITFQCGASRIHMNQAGFITITGTVITSAATVNNSMVAPMTEVVGAVMLTQAGAVVLVEGGATHVRGEVLAALKGADVNIIAQGDNVIQGGQVKIN